MTSEAASPSLSLAVSGLLRPPFTWLPRAVVTGPKRPRPLRPRWPLSGHAQSHRSLILSGFRTFSASTVSTPTTKVLLHRRHEHRSQSRNSKTSGCLPGAGPPDADEGMNPLGVFDRNPARAQTLFFCLQEAMEACVGENPQACSVPAGSLSLPPCLDRWQI